MDFRTEIYFLGEATAEGFRTAFGQQIAEKDFYTYILKGGPGTGKSSLMKKIAAEFEGREDVDLYYCSSDPTSLDGVVLKNRKVVVVDGTSPHVFEADYPGVSQSLINLGECWNKELLRENSEEIRALMDENGIWHARARRYLTALSSLNTDIVSIGSLALNREKLNSFLGRYLKKLLPKTQGADGKILLKKLSAITQNGYMTHFPDKSVTRIYVDDKCFAAGDIFLRGVAEAAVNRGYTVVVSLCRLLQNDIYEHVIIPDLKLGFFTINFFNEVEQDNDFRINMERFYDKNLIAAKKQRLSFDRKASLEMKAEAVQSVLKAKAVHDDLERYYIRAVDFSMIDSVTEKLIAEIE